MIRVLVIDDSALMRRHLTQLLSSQPDMAVQTVRNGAEALAAIASFDPHVVTLDVNMPEMDGITCLSHIMVSSPRPVVMVSSITEAGAEVTFQALGLGAVDFIQKPDGTISLSIERVEAEILTKVRAARRARVRRPDSPAMARAPQARPVRAPVHAPAPSVSHLVKGAVLIGVSTGGPNALEELLPSLPADFPWPVLVAQHMPAAFTGSFARRLDAICALEVVEVARQMPMEPGRIYIARGDADMRLTRCGVQPLVQPVPADQGHLLHPSVSRLVESAMEVLLPKQLVAVQLTGMGTDGAAQMAELRRRGGRVVAQDEASCVVFGMPGELVRLGGADLVLPIHRIAAQLISWVGETAHGTNKESRHGTR